MANINQAGEFGVPGGDVPVLNYGASDIPSNTAVLWDTTAGNVNGVVVPTAAGGVAGTAGVTMAVIPAKTNGIPGNGTVRRAGCANVVCNGAVTAGNYVRADDTASHLGQVKAVTAAGTTQSEILGQARMTRADGEYVPVLLALQFNHT